MEEQQQEHEPVEGVDFIMDSKQIKYDKSLLILHKQEHLDAIADIDAKLGKFS